MIKKSKPSFFLKKLLTVWKKYPYRIIYLILIVFLLYILFFLYQYLYIPLAEKENIDPTLVQSKKEVVNQPLFKEIIKRMEDKAVSSSNIPETLNDPFKRY